MSNSTNFEGNPFTALLGSANIEKDVPVTINENTQSLNKVKSSVGKEKPITEETLNEESFALESALLVSTGPKLNSSFPCIFLENDENLSTNNVNVILFERIMMLKPRDNLIGVSKNKSLSSKEKQDIELAVREKVLVYLSEVYCRASRESKEDIKNVIKESVIGNMKTILELPEIIETQDIRQQFVDLLIAEIPNSKTTCELISCVINRLHDENNLSTDLLKRVLHEVKSELQKCSLVGFNWNMICILDFYATSPVLAPLILEPQLFTDPRCTGRQYSDTILGSVLVISCLPKSIGASYDFFENPSRQPAHSHKATESSIGLAQKMFQSRVCQLFRSLLKVSAEVKDLLLKWIEHCLKTNSGRAGLWHIQAEELRGLSYVSDGFMVNLCAVLNQLSQPFVKDISTVKECTDYKILKVDPNYCNPMKKDRNLKIKGDYSGDLHEQTSMIPLQEGSKEPPIALQDQYSFITSCFFMTHRALHQGLHVVIQKLNKLSQELSRIQSHFEDASAQGSPAAEMMRKHMESKMTTFLSLKAAVFEPEFVENYLQFFAATSFWLTRIASQSRSGDELSKLFQNPSPEGPQSSLQFIPEFLIENIVGALTAIKRYCPDLHLMGGSSNLNAHLMTFIVSFMGHPHWIHNPHLKANLAESLECFIPKDSDKYQSLSMGSHQKLFTDHPMAKHQARSLINVFVSIEMTGQSVAFEEKFNYRRPMYEILKYLWEFSGHRSEFLSLAKEALENMESAQTPLFLRFVNFLMNDAIFLLDEGLSYMAQIKDNQNLRDTDEWNQLPSDQRAEMERNTQQMSMLARFHNLLGSKTIETISKLTKAIPNMFIHPTLIDRMAAMLNHFLIHLVGPKQRNIKVRDMKKYEFRPSDIVVEICTIYINLKNFPTFAVAVVSDGRSYNPKLFDQACNVLSRIGHHKLEEEVSSFSTGVKVASEKQTADDDLVAEAPEEFLDPIMSHIMTDPVTLPSSQIVVDRSTIARHLLSDQIDPFNRQPLTMDEVIQNNELRLKIQEWIEEQKAKRKSTF